MTSDFKRDYLVKTFSRTKRKDYENYILNAIWHKLDRSDIQPVTQQFIKRADGWYALVDLYFPQLSIAVECDEAHHIENAEYDLKRTLTMEEVLSAYDETEDFLMLRIKAYENIESVERQIDNTVSAIKDRIRQKGGAFPVWNYNESPYDTAIARKQIHVADRLAFRTIVDICRCFGRNYKNMQTAYFNIGYGYQLWCPKLAIYVDGKATSVSRGWINTLSDDWQYTFQENDDPDKLRNVEGSRQKRPRITFAKSTDVLGRSAYRFIGVYEVDNSHPKASRKVEVHRRTSEYIDLSPWLNESKKEKESKTK